MVNSIVCGNPELRLLQLVFRRFLSNLKQDECVSMSWISWPIVESSIGTIILINRIRLVLKQSKPSSATVA